MKNIFNRKSVFVKSLSVWSAFAVIITTSAPAFAAGTAVLGGSADLQNLTRATMDKNDPNAAVFSSDAASAVLDWNRFNIGSGQSMSFNGAGTTFFNLVDGAAGRSQIDGIINGSGNVWVINPAGIAFGASSSVNVGGLFAAAAGNLENAAALRDGTATMPSFSSFEGSVDASKGTFTASQVALMGKTVSAEGDFSNVGNLTISATGGAMDVDEVQGGKVSVNIRDFTADGSEVTLGDLHIDGDLTVKATGSIMAGAKAAETPANKPMLLMAEKKGPIIQAGDIDIEGADLEIEGKLQSTAGHVDVLAHGNMDVNADVEAANYVKLRASGDVDVAANITAHGGDVTVFSEEGGIVVEKGATVQSDAVGGNVSLVSTLSDYTFAEGSVSVDGDIKAGVGGDVNIYAGYGAYTSGDVEINGSVEGEQVFVGAGAYFGNPYGYYDVFESYGLGDISVKGNVTGGSRVMLATVGGDIEIGQASPAEGVKASVRTTGAGAEIDIDSAIAADYSGTMPDSGNVKIYGNAEIEAAGAGSTVLIAGGYGYGADGNVDIAGKVSSAGDAHVYAGMLGNGNAAVATGGEVSGNRVFLAAGEQYTDIDPWTYEPYDGLYGFGASFGLSVSGNVTVDGMVTGSERVDVGAYNGTISGAGKIDTVGSLNMNTGVGGIDFAGVVKAKDADFKVDEVKDVTYKSGSGSALFLENTENDFTGKFTAQAGVIKVRDANDITLGDVTAYRDYGDVRSGEEYRAVTVYALDGTLTVDEGATVKSEGVATTVTLAAGTGTKFDTEGNPVPTKGNVNIKGDVRADTTWAEIDIFSGTGANGGEGDIVIDGTVSSQTPDDWVVAGYGGLGVIEIAAGYMKGSKPSNVIVNGTVTTDGKAMVSAGDSWGTDPSTGEIVQMGGAGDVVINGAVQGGHHATITTRDGDITVAKGSAVSIATEGEVTVVSGIKDGGSGNITVAGDIHADVDNGKVLLASGYGKKAQGNVMITGNVTARQIAFAQGGIGEGAKGNVTIADGATFIAGSDTATDAHADLYTGSGAIVIQNGATVEAKGAYAQVNAVAGYGKGSNGSIEVGGTARAVGSKGIVNLLASYGEQSRGGVSVSGHVESDLFSLLTTGEGNISVSRGGSVVANADNGKVELGSGLHNGAEGNVNVDGRVAALGKEAIVSVESGRGNGSHGNVSIAGSVSAGNQAVAYAGFGEGASGSASVSGEVSGGEEVDILTRSGAISINGSVRGGQDAQLIAGVNNGQGGDISFGANGSVTAGSLVNVVTSDGNVRQSGASVAINQSGYAEVVSIPSAVSAPEVNFNVNGNVGAGAQSPVAASGNIYGQVSGNASFAAANGQSFAGGSKPAHTPTVKLSVSDVTATATASTTESAGKLEINTTPASQSLASGIDWGGASDNSSIFAGGDLSIYTAGSLNPYGLLVAGRDLTVSAASFGDMSYLRAGGKLTINNVGHPSHPQIAYFESVNGVEPNINNLPNDMVIFIDGRLAGGNLNILNKFGANEAFMVETPELKSTQGIFGNPPFLHSDLDVANPMAVSAVDYLIQEVPRLTLSSDFPAEVDQNVEAVGLSQKDVYWFGQKGSDEKKASDEAAEKTAETDKGSEKPSDKTVALLR